MNMARIGEIRNRLLDVVRAIRGTSTVQITTQHLRRIADVIDQVPGTLPDITPSLLQQINSVAKDLDNRVMHDRAVSPVKFVKRRRKLILFNNQSPGDILMLTAAVRDLVTQHSDKFIVDVRTSVPDIWFYNPYLTRVDEKDPQAEVLTMEYPLIQQSNEGQHHFIHGFRKHMEKILNLQINPGVFKGDIFLHPNEKAEVPLVERISGKKGPYWIIVNGGKMDYTAKWWNSEYAQAVVDGMPDVTFVKCGAVAPGHKHFELKNVVDLTGKTSFREVIKVVYNSAGIICPVTCFMHLAIAVEPNRQWTRGLRPCIVTAGGREPIQWEQYPGHQYLNTIGMLDCCAYGGCWRSRAERVGDGDEKDNSLCSYPIKTAQGAVPKCMMMIKPEEVVAKIKAYMGRDV